MTGDMTNGASGPGVKTAGQRPKLIIVACDNSQAAVKCIEWVLAAFNQKDTNFGLVHVVTPVSVSSFAFAGTAELSHQSAMAVEGREELCWELEASCPLAQSKCPVSASKAHSVAGHRDTSPGCMIPASLFLDMLGGWARGKLCAPHFLDMCPALRVQMEGSKSFLKEKLLPICESAGGKHARVDVIGCEDDSLSAVGDAISRFAESAGADLIVASRHSEGAISQLFLGSTTARLAESSAVPLTILP